MARATLMPGPGVTHRLDGAWNGSCTPTVVCVHTSVTSLPAPAATFSVMWDGSIVQHRHVNAASAANLNGNYRCIAIEFMDKGQGFPPHDDNSNTLPPLTAAQIESGARIIAWAHAEWGIPIQFVTDSRPTTRGVASHRAGIDGNFAGYAFAGRVPGGELWSSAYGKICARDVRIRQTRDIMVPRALVLAGYAQEEDMALTAEDFVTIWYSPLVTLADGSTRSGAQILNSLIDDESKVLAAVEAARLMVVAEVDTLEESAAAEGTRDAAELARDTALVAKVDALTDDESKVLAAIRAIPPDVVELTPEQLADIADAIAAVVPPAVRGEVRAAFADAGEVDEA